MKNILLIIVTLIITSSCSYENDLFEAYKDAPYLFFSYKGENLDGISDSIKIATENLGSQALLFDMKINDKSNNLKVLYNLLQGQGLLRVGSSLIEKDLPTVISRGNHQCRYIPERTGQHRLELSLIDLYGNTIKRKASFVVFTNLPPVASFDVKTIGQYSKYEIEIDASKSWDQDEKWGGQIVEYIYKIGSYYEFRTSEFPSIKHILPGEGSYVISMQVRDNNQALSEPVFQEIKF